jgi:hypothetical protein
MYKRVLLAGIIAGIALFVWESIAHMATPLGTAGFQTLPNEAAAIASLNSAVQNSGMFIFPMPAADGTPAPAGTPAGLLVFHRQGMAELTPAQLGTQLAADIGSMLLVAFLVAQLGPVTFGARFLVALALALLPALRAHLPHWNWYGFPMSYTAAQILMDLAGFAAGGAVIAKMVQSRSRTMAAAS